MPKSVTVKVKVNIEQDRTQPSGYRFLNLKIGDEPPIPLPDDKPTPRRLRQQLVEAAKRSLGDVARPTESPVPATDSALASDHSGPPGATARTTETPVVDRSAPPTRTEAAPDKDRSRKAP